MGSKRREGDVLLKVHVRAHELSVRGWVIEEPAGPMRIEPYMHVGMCHGLQFALPGVLVEKDMCNAPPYAEAMSMRLD